MGRTTVPLIPSILLFRKTIYELLKYEPLTKSMDIKKCLIERGKIWATAN
jgi:hypothetical protein